MGKIAVRVVNPDNLVKDESGKRLEPYVIHQVEESDHVKKSIQFNLLERVREAEKPEEVKEEKSLPAPDPKEANKK